MDLRTWGFITSPKESTDSAYPSLVSLEGLMGSELESGKAPRIVVKAFFPPWVLFVSGYQFRLWLAYPGFSVSFHWREWCFDPEN